MGNILRVPFAWEYKPPLGTPLDRDHPQARGVRGEWLFNEAAGSVANNLAAPYQPGTLVGGLAWGAGTGGLQLSGFSSSNYVTASAYSQLATSPTLYPFWLSAWFTSPSSTATTTGSALVHSWDTAAAEEVILYVNLSTLGVVGYFAQSSDASFAAASATGLAINDGKPHHVMAVSWGPSDHRIYLDGVGVGSGTSTLTGDFSSLSQFTLGCRRKDATVDLPLTGGLIQARIGAGSSPDVAGMAREPYGIFLAPTTRRFFAAPTPPGVALAGFASPLSLWLLGRMGVPAGSTSFAMAATLDDVGLGASFAASSPASSALSFASTLADVGLSANFTATAVGASSLAFAATLDDASLVSSFVATAPGSSTLTFSTTLGDATLAASLTATAPGSSAATLAASLDATTLASSFVALASGSSALTLAASLDAASLASSFVASAPGSSALTLAASLGDATLAASFVATAPASASFTITSALNASTLASSFLAAASGDSVFAFAATVVSSLAASFVATAPASSALTLAATIDATTLASSFLALGVGDTTFAFVAALLDAGMAAVFRAGPRHTKFASSGAVSGVAGYRSTGTASGVAGWRSSGNAV